MASAIVFEGRNPSDVGVVWLEYPGGVPFQLTAPGTAAQQPGGGFVGGDFANVGDLVYMTGEDAEGYDGLWALNGQSLTEVYGQTGTTALQPYNITAFDNLVLFDATTPGVGQQLWVSDGSEAGTAPITGAPIAGDITPYNGFALFAAGGGSSGLWRTDGTSAGTYQIPVEQDGETLANFGPDDLTAIGGVVYFNAGDASGKNGLWVTSGTTATTSEISIAGANSTLGVDPDSITSFGSLIAFAGVSAAGTHDLWIYNPANGAATDIAPTGTPSFGLYPTNLTEFDGALYFSAFDSAGQNELWTSDGTTAGTHMIDVAGASTGSAGLNPGAFAVNDGLLYFHGVDSAGLDDLWSYDGTEASPQIVAVPADETASGIGLAPADITTVNVACYLRGTRIATLSGEVEIERLAIGDRVLTASGGSRPVLWIGHRRLDATTHPAPRDIWPVLVREGAFGDNRPSRDLWLSPGHNVVVDGALMPIILLCNGRTIEQVHRTRIDYWHVELDAHDIILADGLPAESYLDTGNRCAFENGGAFVEAHPDFRPKHWAETCLPLLGVGAELVAAKRALLARAGTLGHRVDVTDADDLHILADGRRVEPVRIGPRRAAFMPPAGCSRVVLKSRSFVPAHYNPASDDTRTLGVQVTRLQIDGADVRLDEDIGRDAGWHAFEPEIEARWTDGSTQLPSGVRLVVIDLLGKGHYWNECDEDVAAPCLLSEREENRRRA